MKVWELINQLEQYDEDEEVELAGGEDELGQWAELTVAGHIIWEE